jgi:hypothetical protein
VQRQTSVNAGQGTIVELGFVRETEPQAFFADDGEPEQTEEAAPPSDESSGGGNTLAYIAGGVGVAGLAAFTAFGLMANSTYDDLEQACPNDQCPPERRDDIDTGKQQQTIANIGLAVGIVGLGTGAALLLFGGKKTPETKASAELTIGPGSVRIRGSF